MALDRRELLSSSAVAGSVILLSPSLAACVLRDAEHHALTREIAGLRYGPYVEAYRQVLGTGLNAKQRVLLNLALNFFTWRSLVRDSGLGQNAAIAAMVQAIESA
jgi:hypothetical protein